MTDHQAPSTAPGFTGLPLPTRPTDRPPAPLRRAWSVRRRAAAAIAVLALAGSGTAVATAGLAGSDDEHGVEGVTPPAGPVQPGTTSPSREREPEEAGESDESDEA